MAEELTRGEFIRIAATGVAGGLLAACAPNLNLSPIQAETTRQTLLPEGKRIADLLPPWMLSGLARIQITPLERASGAMISPVGTGQVYIETRTHIVVSTAEHVGKGIFWKDVDLHFPYAYQAPNIHVDARIGVENGPKPTDEDWWIQAVTRSSDVDNGIYHPIRSIIIRKPVGFDGYVTRPEYPILRAYQGQPKRGDIFYHGGFPTSTGGRLVFSELQYQTDTKLYDGGEIEFNEFRGSSDEGMSGAMIMTESGECVSLVRGGRQDSHTQVVYGIPFAKYNPLQDILSKLEALQ